MGGGGGKGRTRWPVDLKPQNFSLVVDRILYNDAYSSPVVPLTLSQPDPPHGKRQSCVRYCVQVEGSCRQAAAPISLSFAQTVNSTQHNKASLPSSTIKSMFCGTAWPLTLPCKRLHLRISWQDMKLRVHSRGLRVTLDLLPEIYSWFVYFFFFLWMWKAFYYFLQLHRLRTHQIS